MARTYRHSLLRAAATALCIATSASIANAAILTVDTALDVVNAGDGVLSLREALADANPSDEIQFDSSLNGQTIVLGGSELVVDRNLTITGPGAALLAIDADALSRVLLIETGIVATISGLTFQNGDTSAIVFGDKSGAGFNNRGDLAISDCVVTNNQGPANMVGAGVISTQSLVRRVASAGEPSTPARACSSPPARRRA